LPVEAGELPKGVGEASGLAVSRREAGVYWTHNDSGGAPVLQAMAADGKARGTVWIEGVKNVDWEDMASFTLEGRAWLLVADVGDNQSGRSDCVLHVIAEPESAQLREAVDRDVPLVAKVAWSTAVVYPDGPRDCEAVAVDAAEGRVYLLAKRVVPHGLYSLPLRPKPGAAPVAERVGELGAFPGAEGAELLLPMPTGRYRGQPTGMDFAADGTAAVVVTYGEPYVYPKFADETWAQALARPGVRLAPHWLSQAEAVCFGGDDGREIVVTSEGKRAALVRYTHVQKAQALPVAVEQVGDVSARVGGAVH
jgi:hypothetical protein